MNGTRKRMTTARRDGTVEHVASFRSADPIGIQELHNVLKSLEDELADEGLVTNNAEVRVSGKGFSMIGATMTGIALVVTERAGKA